MTTLTHAIQQLHARTAPPSRARDHAAPRAALTRRAGSASLLAGDIAALVAAVVASGAPLWLLAVLPAVLGALAARGLYGTPAGALDTLRDVVVCISSALGGLVLGVALVVPAAVDPAAVSHAWLVACVLLGAHRLAVAVRRRGEAGIPTVVLGAPGAADDLAARLAATPAAGLRPIAVFPFDLSDHCRPADLHGLARLAREAGGREVVVAAGEAPDTALGVLARACDAEGLRLAVRTSLGDAGGALAVEQAGPLPLLRVQPVDTADWRLAVKHALDRIVAALLLAAVAPLFAVLALGVRLSSPGPVLFRQRRVGRDGREFAMLKFRSMREAPASPAALLRLPDGTAPGGVEGADRRTRIGVLLRRTSLDELPQLLNVLRGDMSLVGPRPERPEYVARFSADVARYGERHRLKSGITGLAQVEGLRGKTSIADRVAYDNHYVEHWSPWLDVKILLRTLRAVLDPAE